MRARYVVMCIMVALLPAPVWLLSASDEGAAACDALASRLPKGKRQLFYMKPANVLCLAEGSRTVWWASASHGRAEGKKQYEGDNRTPEGHYSVRPARHSKKFGLFLPISYPNADDVRAARALGRSPGGAVGIHGPQRWYAFLGSAQSLVNHSDGCIVVDEQAIRELAKRIERPTPIAILAALPDR